MSIDINDANEAPTEVIPNETFSLSKFSLRGESKLMEEKMLLDTFVLDRIAILGQATTIYAKPNTGKTLLTLWMIIESIKAGRVNGDDVYYVNADDNYKGLVHKTRLAEKYGFHILSPQHKGFDAAELQGYMRQMIDDGTASGKIIILDTLKKFTNLMDKTKGSEFMNRAREFVSNGGTLIMLAHTNKRRDRDNKVVFGGTSDIVDDCDCVFTLDEVSRGDDVKSVLFENMKCRGDVATEIALSYSMAEGASYENRLESIEIADKAKTEKAKIEKANSIARERDYDVIKALTEFITNGVNQKTELVKAANDYCGTSKARLIRTLEKYEGKNFLNGDLWYQQAGAKNLKTYHLLTGAMCAKEDYEFAKNKS